jgi:hypothetical protein
MLPSPRAVTALVPRLPAPRSGCSGSWWRLPFVALGLVALVCAPPLPGGAAELPAALEVRMQGLETGGIEGRVRDGLGRPVRAVTVIVLPVGADAVLGGATTDQTGYFRVERLPAGPARVRFLRIGYAPDEVEATVRPGERLRLDRVLGEAAVVLEGVGVTGDQSRARDRFETETGITVREITREQIRRLPGLAEADPVRALEVLPGVVAPTDFSAAFHVRGGSSDQNLILLDGFPIFNPFHLGGIFSVFNADLVDRVELAAGGFPASYGGRVSSVLRVESDAGPGTREVDAGISLLAARATLSGGVPDGAREALGLATARWRVAGRRSYVDQLLRPVTELPYHIGDLQGIVEAWTPGGSRWTLTGYTGADVLDLGRIEAEDFPLRIYWRWGNRMGGARWLRGLDGGGQLEARAGVTRFDTRLRFEDFDDSRFGSRIDQVTLATEFRLPLGGGWELDAGVGADRYDWENFAETGGTVFGEDRSSGWNTAAWLQGGWRPSPAWNVDAGVRLEGWRGGGLEVLVPAPRLAVRRLLADGDLALKVSAGRYAQFVHSIRDEELPLGIDVWVTAGEGVPHLVSDQLQLGLEAFLVEGWYLSADAFYRDFQGVVTQNPVRDPNDPGDTYLAGRGRGFGADMLVERRTGRVQGSLSLSLLKADRTFPDVFSGTRDEVTYAPLFDRRLDADLVLRFPLGRGWDGGLRWHVGSGLPYTRPVASYPVFGPRQTRDGRLRWVPDAEDGDDVEEEGPTGVLLGERNGERYPVYHRLDLSARRSFRTGWGQVTPYLNVLNVYNQPNVLFYFFDFQTQPATRSGLTMFPFLPTIGVEVAF